MSRQRLKRLATFAAAAITVTLLAACGSSGTKTSKLGSSGASPLSGTIVVFAASSLTESFTTIGKAFEAAHPGTRVTVNFGASSTLANQIIQAPAADVFASASTANMKQVTDANQASTPQTFANNTGEIAVAPDQASKVKSLADLARSDVKVALCQPQVPCGAIATEIFTKAGIRVNPVTQGLDVKSTLAYVTNGSADAAIVYVTDVKAAGSMVVGVEIPAAQNASTAYPIATVNSTKNLPLAQAFEDYVLSASGQSALKAAGFLSP
jgi:molybdate transport system substrate-binding protein